MKLQDIIDRKFPPAPWSEGDNIPWNDPGFSRRMLKEHLSQDHDAASRRAETIDRHTDWIHRAVLREKKSRILDIGCGPGLYLQRLARLGHRGVGIDYSPASIEYAREEAAKERLEIEYRLVDMREAEFGEKHDLVIGIYGEFNVFTRPESENILKRAAQSLTGGGRIVLEVQRFDSIKQRGRQPASWHSAPSGLFSDRPYLCLQENFWDEDSKATTIRFYVVDVATAAAESFSVSYQAYEVDEYETLLNSCGFENMTQYLSLSGREDDQSDDMFVLVAHRA